MQQSIGIGFDLLASPNNSRKQAGTRFEELLKCILFASGISNKKNTLKIPCETKKGKEY